MLSSIKRRAGVVLTVGAVAASTLLVAPAPQAQADAVAQNATATWLTAQLGADNLVNGDVGATIDFGLALAETGGAPATIDRVTAGIDAGLAAYTTDGVSAAHAAMFYQSIGVDPRTKDGDLIAQVEAATNDDTGDMTTSFGGAWSQWLAVRSLDEAGSAEAPKAIANLVSIQCADGASAGAWGYDWDAMTCGDPDQTAQGILGLLPESGTSVVVNGTTVQINDVIDAAVDWLKAKQQPNGAWVAFGAASANSTALAVKALADADEQDAARRGAAWLRRVQVAGSVCDGKLSGQQGAVAATESVLADGRSGGLVDPSGYDWYLSSIQALPALVNAPAGGTLKPVAPLFVKASSTVTITASGLPAGANGCISFAGKNVAVQGGTTTRVTIAVPAGTKVRTATLKTVGASATATVTALAPRTLPIAKRALRVRKGRLQTVKVTGMKAGEKVTVRYRGRVIARGRANVNGAFRKTFRVGRTTGVMRVTATGQFGTRHGATTFRVVR